MCNVVKKFSPGDIGADVCHLNLHKTFAIPHGGGGPGMGPICVAAHLVPFLPDHPVVPLYEDSGHGQHIGAVSAAPWGSAGILVIPWMYIRMMGPDGLTEATKVAILNANYIAYMLGPFYPVIYRGQNRLVAHECIVDLRGWEKCGIKSGDVAKRLMDFGFHPPTMDFPVHGTFMIEPTESEPLSELKRFCQAMMIIYGEMEAVRTGVISAADSPLKHAPHTAAAVCATEWNHIYSRETAAFPYKAASKFWPAVGRIDEAYGDRNLVCCWSVEDCE